MNRLLFVCIWLNSDALSGSISAANSTFIKFHDDYSSRGVFLLILDKCSLIKKVNMLFGLCTESRAPREWKCSCWSFKNSQTSGKVFAGAEESEIFKLILVLLCDIRKYFQQIVLWLLGYLSYSMRINVVAFIHLWILIIISTCSYGENLAARITILQLIERV